MPAGLIQQPEQKWDEGQEEGLREKEEGEEEEEVQLSCLNTLRRPRNSQNVAGGWKWPLPFCNSAVKAGWALQPLELYAVQAGVDEP